MARARTARDLVTVAIGGTAALGLVAGAPAVAGVAGTLGTIRSVIDGWISGEAVARLGKDERDALRTLEDRMMERIERVAADCTEWDEAFVDTLLGMIADGMPTRSDLAEGNLSAAGVFQVVGRKLGPLAGSRKGAWPVFAQILPPMLEELLDNGALTPDLAMAANRAILARLDALAGTLAAMQAQLDRMEAAADARTVGIPDTTLIQMARRIAEDVPDADAALRELDRAVDVAAKVQREGQAGSNSDVLVDRVLRDVASLSRDDRLEDAAEALDAAIAREREELARRTTGVSRLMRSAEQQAVLRRDAEAAADYIVQRLELEHPERRDRFEALSDEREEWYGRARDCGTVLDLAVAVFLARRMIDLAETHEERAHAQNNLGMALLLQAERSGSEIAFYQASLPLAIALKELSWLNDRKGTATAALNLGAAYSGLAGLTGDQKFARTAIEHYASVLEDLDASEFPRERGMILANLGAIVLRLGETTGDTEFIELAIDTLDEASRLLTRERDAKDWAQVEANLGAALSALGKRRADGDTLERASEAMRKALGVYTPEDTPLDWARTKLNLSGALSALGGLLGDANLLGVAVQESSDALAAIPKEDMAQDWAWATLRHADALHSLGEATVSETTVGKAVAAYRDALAVLGNDVGTSLWAEATTNLANALATLGEWSEDDGDLKDAVAAYEAVLARENGEARAFSAAVTRLNLGDVLLRRHQLTGEAALWERAHEVTLLALDVFREASSPAHLRAAEANLAEIEAARP